MVTGTFASVITTVEELREVIGDPSGGAIQKDIGVLDQHCRAIIATSPFLLLATCGASGACDVSPKGDAPGFVQVLDDQTLVIPDRPGNRRLDSYRNVIENPHVGLIFLVPGMEETLRVNGRAEIVRDDAILERCVVEGKRPLLALAVHVEEAFIHCPKCFRRAKMWDTATWPERSSLPTMARMMVDMLRIEDVPLETVEAAMEKGNQKLY